MKKNEDISINEDNKCNKLLKIIAINNGVSPDRIIQFDSDGKNEIYLKLDNGNEITITLN